MVDPKSAGQCVLRVESLPIKSGEAARRLPLFGAVSTECGPRSVKAGFVLPLAGWQSSAITNIDSVQGPNNSLASPHRFFRSQLLLLLLIDPLNPRGPVESTKELTGGHSNL